MLLWMLLLQGFKMPANMPKTQSMLAARMGAPAPIFRPPGAADIDYAKNKNTDIRYQQQSTWRSSTPNTAMCEYYSVHTTGQSIIILK